jgi:polysaccharide deacetylase 2 family uncharacterized protein YibQ
MPRKPSRSAPDLPRTLVVLLVSALLLFLGGEAWFLARSGRADVLRLRWRMGGRARVVSRLAGEIRAGLQAAGVAPDSVRTGGAATATNGLRWRVGLKPGASLFQANYAVTRRVEDFGGAVLGGRETQDADGATRVVLRIGLPRQPMHQVELVRPAGTVVETERAAPRLALVLYGFGNDVDETRRCFALSVPFAVAVVPGARTTQAELKAARECGREVVLQVPLEPVNYPQLDPGPGTLLVTMKPDRIAGTVRRWLDQAEPVVAVANHMGSLATQDMTLMGAVYREVKREHLTFLHVEAAAGSVCRPLAADMGVLYEQPDLVLDAEARAHDTKRLDARWAEALERARQRGHAMVWLRATPRSLEWLPRATTARRLGGVDLAPLSGVMRRPAIL